MRPNTGQCMRDVRAHRASAGSAYWWVQSPPPNLSGGPTRFRIEVFSSVKDAEASWRAAEAAGVCYGFECFEWLSTWQETIGTFEAVKPCIVRVVDEDSVTVMLLPLGIRRYFGWAILSFLGGQLSDYNAPILRADFARNVGAVQFNVLWEEVLRRLPPIDMICLARLPKYIDGVENPFTRLPGAQHHANSHFAILENSFLQFQCGRSPHFRKDTKRQRRRLEKIGEVSFRVASTTTEVAATMAALVRQRFDQGRELGYRTTFHIPAYRIFYEKMALEHYHHGLIQVCALFVNNKIIAAHWGMKYRNRLYWLMPAYERGSCAKYSPGRLLLENLLEWCFNNHVAVFDLTVGDEPYKLQWADRSMALFELDQSRSAKGLVLVYARRLLFHIKDRIKRYPRLFALLRRARRLFGISHWSPL